MLIRCERHTPEDLEHWNELEEMDLAYYRTHDMRRLEYSAHEAIGEFIQNPCYLGVSWGKDSITVLNLCLQSGFSGPVVCSIGSYKTRATNIPYLMLVAEKFKLENYQEIIYPEYPQKSKQKSLRDYQKRTLINRYISGVRANESKIRRFSRKIHGKISANTCRPIIDWPTEAVFAYCAYHNLPLHPNYGMTGGGRWPREHIRVGGSIGGGDGINMGRREWEQEYYADLLRAIQ